MYALYSKSLRKFIGGSQDVSRTRVKKKINSIDLTVKKFYVIWICPNCNFINKYYPTTDYYKEDILTCSFCDSGERKVFING